MLKFIVILCLLFFRCYSFVFTLSVFLFLYWFIFNSLFWFDHLYSFFFCPLSFLNSFVDINLLLLITWFMVFRTFWLQISTIVNQKSASIYLFLMSIYFRFIRVGRLNITLFLIFFFFSFFLIVKLFLSSFLGFLFFPFCNTLIFNLSRKFNPLYFSLLIIILIFSIYEILFMFCYLFSKGINFLFELTCLLFELVNFWVPPLFFNFF